MKPMDIFLAFVEAGLWIFVTYYFLYSIKNPVDVFQSAVIIVAFTYLACWACPMIRNSCGWRRMTGKEK
jgi:hypothetical protein